MNNVYVVISVKSGAELETCEVYLDKQVALGRASAIAHFVAVHHPEWVQNPKDTGLDIEDTRRWVFLDSYSNYVAVHSKKVWGTNQSKTADPLESVKNFSTDLSLHLTLDDIRAVVFDSEKYSPIDFEWAKKHSEQCALCKGLVAAERAENPLLNLDKDLAYVQNTINQALNNVIQTPADDPMDRSLPAGWTYNNKPATMADLFDDPYNVKPIDSLSEAQKWALVTSRVSKRLNFTAYLPGIGNCNQPAALLELKNKTTLGKEIVELECTWLDQTLTDQTETEEESSSSSEEEDY